MSALLARAARLLRLVVVVALVPFVLDALAAESSAQTTKPKSDARTKDEAGRLKSAADVLMDQDRYADALTLYERAYELSSDPALLYNAGRAYEALGDYPKALDKLELFDQTAPPAIRARVPGLRELITDLRGRIATLVVKSSAPNARLLVRQKDEGVISVERRIPMRAGPVSIEVAAEGYETFRRELELSAGATVVVEAILVAKKRDALVVIRTTPSADLRLDGKPLGRAPLQVRAAPGEHELVATAEGYYEERVPMTLALGERRDVELELRSTPGIASKWWFWTGISAVVLGGVATAIVLTTEKPHSHGTFAPGSIAGP